MKAFTSLKLLIISGNDVIRADKFKTYYTQIIYYIKRIIKM